MPVHLWATYVEMFVCNGLTHGKINGDTRNRLNDIQNYGFYVNNVKIV